MKTLIFWFLMWTHQYKKAERYADKLIVRGYGMSFDGWYVRKISNIK